LKIGPSGFLLHTAKSAPRRVRQLRPRRCTRGRRRFRRRPPRRWEKLRAVIVPVPLLFG